MLNKAEKELKELSIITRKELIDAQAKGKNIWFEIQNELEDNYVWI